jgi:uncharacterized DUF497 family protein
MGKFEWQPEKAKSNHRKHGITFKTAAEVFEDPFAVETLDELSTQYGEERFLIVGRTKSGLILSVVYTERGERIRIISARRATKSEREKYRDQNPQD